MNDVAPDIACLHDGEQAFRRNLDHAIQRQADVDANPAPQRWEIEHAREPSPRRPPRWP